MSIRTTVTFDEDVLDRGKRQSRARGASFRETLNDLLREALVNREPRHRRRALKIRPAHRGYRAGLNYDYIESPLAIQHRASGPLVSDAVLAALAIGNGALLASTDQGLGCFPSPGWNDPLGRQ
jgi:predicted nucleic acid-binding protein